MQPKALLLANVASWVIFAAALALAVVVSFLLLAAASMWGVSQVIGAGPLFVLVAVYMASLPLIFGTIGLFRSSANRRLLAATGMLLSIGVCMFVAAGQSFDWL